MLINFNGYDAKTFKLKKLKNLNITNYLNTF